MVTLAGKVLAHGVPVGRHHEVTIATDSLSYDMVTQELSSGDHEVVATRAGSTFRGRALRANARTGSLQLESGHATLIP